MNLAWDLASNHKLYASFNSFYDKGKGNTLSDLELSADTYEDRTDGYTHRGYTDDLYTANIEFSSNKDKNNRHNISYSYIWGKARNTADTEETKNGIPSRISTRNHHNGGQHQLKYDYRYKFNSYSNFHAGVRTDFGELKPYSDINLYRPTDTVYLDGYHIQENLYAAYVNFDYKTGAFHWLLGLRGEYSDFSARSVETGISVDYRKLHLFPAMSINWKSSPMADFSLQLSSGIDRPPFLYYVPNYRYSSEYSVSIGNPALEPAKYYSINLLSFLFDFLSIQLSYSLTTDKYETVSRMGDTEFQNVSTYDNLYDAHKLKFEINCPYLFWNNRISGNIGILGTRSFFRNFANDIAGMGNKESGLLITNFTQIDVTKQLNIGYNLLYQSKSHFSQATMDPMFKLDIEAAYRIKDFTLGFNVNDIFNTYTPRTIYKYETGTSVVNRNNFSPSFNFVLKYAIGKEQTRKTHSGADASRFK